MINTYCMARRPNGMPFTINLTSSMADTCFCMTCS